MPWLKEAPYAGFTEAPEPWLPIPADHQGQAVDVQDVDPDSLLNKYRRLIQWRRQQPALITGSLQLVEMSDERLVGFTRECNQQRLLCIFNLSPETVYQDLRPFHPYAPTDELDFIDRRYHDTLEIPPFGVFFANLKPGQG